MDHLHYRLNFDPDKNFTAWKSITKLVIFQSFVAKCCKMRITCEVCRFSVILYYAREIDSPIGCWGINFPFVIKMTENCKFRKAILSAFYNISQRKFGILLILWCPFKLWWHFCLDQNLVYNANGPLMLRDLVDGNMECTFYTFIRPNQECCEKCNYRPFGWNRTCDSGAVL
jgi:hypothetical protein